MFAILLSMCLQAPVEVDVSAYVRAHRAADRALVAGRAAEARAGFERCLELAPQNATVAYGLACAHAKAGAKDAAFEWLARAAEWGYADAKLALWDEDLASLRGEARFDAVRNVMFNSNGRPPNDALVGTYDRRSRGGPVDVAIDRAATRIAVGMYDGRVVLLDARSGATVAALNDLASPVWDIAMRPDGKGVVALTWDGKLNFWSPDCDRPRTSVEALAPTAEEFGWPFGALLEFDCSGEFVLVGGRARGASLWNAKGETVRRFDGSFGGFFEVEMAWSADGKRIASWNGGTVRFFDGRTGAERPERLTTRSPTYCVAFDPLGRWIATGHEDGAVRLWAATTLGLVRQSAEFEDWTGSDFWIADVSFSPRGDKLALTTGSGMTVRVLDSTDCKTLWTSEYQGGRMGEPARVVWNADGSRLWFAWVSGSLWLNDVAVDQGFHNRILDRARPPRVGAGGIAVFTNGNAVTAVDTKTGRVLWSRAALGRDGTLFQTVDGWFDASFDDLTQLDVYRSTDRDEGTPLTSLATQLFDPKRMRAQRAGVPLAPLAW